MKGLILLLALGAYIAYGLARKALRFRRNYREAQRSGLPIILSPVWPLWHFYLMFEKLYTPYLRRIPGLRDAEWLNVCPGDWVWQHRYGVFERNGDTFMIVTDWKNIVYTCDAGAISQITARRADFPKPVEVYGTMNIYGRNVVSAEGAEWRRHRKITAPPFTEKNNHLVWKESLYQARNMVRQWTGPDGEGGKTWDNISADAMRLSLHIISRAGFNVRCLWPGIDDDDEKALKDGAMSTAVIPDGHEMSYVEAMSTLLHRIILVFIVPEWAASESASGRLHLSHTH
ncbi:MAG: cytochrome P450 [Terriglobus roseus]|nr:cytochrome P450 [Terriglobus roseus]